MEKKLDVVVYMVELEDGLSLEQWRKIMGQFHPDDQLITIEASRNNTTMIGLLNNDKFDYKEQIIEELDLICEDWNKEPKDGELQIKIDDEELTIKVLCDYRTVIL